jgi:hypothetical protein
MNDRARFSDCTVRSSSYTIPEYPAALPTPCLDGARFQGITLPHCHLLVLVGSTVLPAIVGPSGLANSERRHFRDTNGLSVHDPDEGSLEGRARRLGGGSKTRGRCRRGLLANHLA